ncbi:MAG: hypothetical protein JO235_29050, partial [Chroococcidiopsidaceae cyanobacterium CP_BM_RX_35]|nr:hypothetical protein [Chroococcidiopsidaceae cyanobacterium CP_BM_RX_35]
MDYQRFIEQLPNLFENWGQESVYPKSRLFQQILEQVESETTANILQLINFAVKFLEQDEIYCEVGHLSVATSIGALLNNPEKMVYVAANFSGSKG